MPEPRITVLMTVYNGAAYLRHSIESVLRQTFEDFEFLIIDDHSCDDSLAIAQSYKDNRIVVYSNPENKGQIKSLNLGLKLAKANYVARLDADDLAFPHWLKRQLFGMEKNPHCAVMSAQAAIIDTQGKIVRTLKIPFNHDQIILRSLISTPINHVGSLMRKDAILRQGGYDENFKISADYKLWSRLIQKGEKIASSKGILVAIRVHEDSLSVVEINKANFSETSQIMRENISLMTDRRLSEEEAARLWKTVFQASSLNDGEFKEGVLILEDVYCKLKRTCAIDKGVAEKFLRNQLLKIYVKRMFFKIRLGEAQAVRLTAGDYMKRYGFLNAAFLFYLASFLGGGVMKFLPRLYEGLIKSATILKTKIKACY